MSSAILGKQTKEKKQPRTMPYSRPNSASRISQSTNLNESNLNYSQPIDKITDTSSATPIHPINPIQPITSNFSITTEIPNTFTTSLLQTPQPLTINTPVTQGVLSRSTSTISLPIVPEPLTMNTVVSQGVLPRSASEKPFVSSSTIISTVPKLTVDLPEEKTQKSKLNILSRSASTPTSPFPSTPTSPQSIPSTSSIFTPISLPQSQSNTFIPSLSKTSGSSSAVSSVEVKKKDNIIYTNVVVIDAHSKLCFITSQSKNKTQEPNNAILKGNVEMIKVLPGNNVVQDTSNQIFSNLTKNKTVSADDMFNFIDKYYNINDATYLGKIYKPGNEYTDHIFNFDITLNNIDSGNIILYKKLADHNSFTNFRDIKDIKNQIINPNKFIMKDGKYVIKLSEIIDILNLYFNNEKYLLINNGCAYINENISFLTANLAANKTKPKDAHQLVLKETGKSFYGGYYDKYIYYKKKYIELQKNLI